MNSKVQSVRQLTGPLNELNIPGILKPLLVTILRARPESQGLTKDRTRKNGTISACHGIGLAPSRLQQAGRRLLVPDARSWFMIASSSSSQRIRHSFRPRAGRSTDIRIECSAVYTLRCLYMARITSRDNKRFVLHGFFHCARPSLRFSGTRRFVVCFGSEG